MSFGHLDLKGFDILSLCGIRLTFLLMPRFIEWFDKFIRTWHEDDLLVCTGTPYRVSMTGDILAMPSRYLVYHLTMM